MQDQATENAVRALYRQLLDFWNQRSADEFASLFTDDGTIIGYDGSIHLTRAGIAAELSNIFSQHETPIYIGIVRSVRRLTKDAAFILAVAGMVPRGELDINPDLNAIQTLLAINIDNKWQVVVFQNTPAAFHGRADLREQLSKEIRQKLPGLTALA